MKKILTLMLIATIATTSFTGCRSEEQSKKDNKSEMVEKKLTSVTVTLPANFFEGEDLNVAAQKMIDGGAKEATVNDDGTITVKMSKSKHSEMIKEMKASLEESFSGMSSGEDFKSVKEVSYNDDFSKITMIADRAEFESGFESFSIIGVGIGALYYQVFDGVPNAEAKVTIDVKDSSTGEVFSTVVLPDDWEKSESSENESGDS